AVGEDANPELAGALHVPLDRHACGLDLPRRHARGLHGLKSVVAEGHVRPDVRDAAVVALLHLAKLGALGGEHGPTPGLLDPPRFALQDLALEHPDLDADDAHLRARLGEAELDVRAER